MSQDFPLKIFSSSSLGGGGSYLSVPSVHVTLKLT